MPRLRKHYQSAGPLASDPTRFCWPEPARYGARLEVPLHQPLNRQSDAYAREGIEINTSTLADWVGAFVITLDPIVQAIQAHPRRHLVVYVGMPIKATTSFTVNFHKDLTRVFHSEVTRVDFFDQFDVKALTFSFRVFVAAELASCHRNKSLQRRPITGPKHKGVPHYL